jgi:hypothetical protein
MLCTGSAGVCYVQVVQVYVTWPHTSLPTPKIQLVAFGRYFIGAGRGVSCEFRVSLEQLAVWDDTTSSYTTVQGTLLLCLCIFREIS